MERVLTHRVLAAFIAVSAPIVEGVLGAEVPCDPTFTALPVFDVGVNAGASALADLNGDGHLDLTTGNRYFLGDGAGAYPDSFGLDDRAWFDVAVQDFDRDGLPDLARVFWPSSNGEIHVLFRREAPANPAELFGERAVLPTVANCWHIVCPDVNEDGMPDIVGMTAFWFQEGLPVHINNGDRTFSDPLYIPMTSPGQALASGDFDGDGHQDIISAEIDSKAHLYFGRGDGTFGSERLGFIATPAGLRPPHRFRAIDLDGDARTELLAVVEDSVLVYFGTDIDPELGLPPVCSLHYPLRGGGRFLEIADMNHDGVLDIVVLTADGDAGFVVVLRGVAGEDMAFVEGERFATGLSGRGSVLAVGDVNGDAWTDVVITTEDTKEGRVFLNDRNCCDPLSAEAGDVNVDAAINLADPISILGHLFGSQPLRCRLAGEVNGDGRIDLADPVYLLTYLFKQGPAPLSEGPVDCCARR